MEKVKFILVTSKHLLEYALFVNNYEIVHILFTFNKTISFHWRRGLSAEIEKSEIAQDEKKGGGGINFFKFLALSGVLCAHLRGLSCSSSVKYFSTSCKVAKTTF